MRLRQIALVAEELEPTVATLCDVLGIEVGFRDPGVSTFGLENAVMPVGDTFLEVVSPAKPDTSAGRFLARRGDGGYMVIVQADDLDTERARLAALGVRIVWELALEDIATLHLHPRDVGGAIVSIDVADPPSSWRWAGPDWERHQRNERCARIVGAEIQSKDPTATAARWCEVLGRPAGQERDGTHCIPLEGAELRFTADEEGRGDGLSAVALATGDADAILTAARTRGLPIRERSIWIAGTRFDLL